MPLTTNPATIPQEAAAHPLSRGKQVISAAKIFLKKTPLGKLSRNTYGQIFRFLVTGSIAFFIDLLGYFFFLNFIDMSFAKAGSFIMAITFTFIMNKMWTFRKKKLSFREIITYILYYSVSMLLNTSINKGVFLLTNQKLLAFMAATGFCMTFNFTGLKLVIFRK